MAGRLTPPPPRPERIEYRKCLSQLLVTFAGSAALRELPIIYPTSINRRETPAWPGSKDSFLLA